ncbi:MAG: site-specific integrase [Alistipes sp.]|jgi:integrase|nr:site-specific integrase [Alistipes sp.]
MANFKFKYNILFFPDKERDGAGYKPDGKLRIRVRWSGSKVDFNVGYRVKLSQWDARTQRCIAKTTNLQKQSASLINGRIQQQGDALENIFKAAELDGTIPTPAEVRAKFNEAAGRANKLTKSAARGLFDYFDEFVREMGQLNNWTRGTFQKFHTARGHLKSYNPELTFANLDDIGLSGYVTHLRDVKFMRNSSVGKQLDLLKWFLRWATANGACRTLDYASFKPKLKTTDKKIIFLDWAELMTVYNHEFDNNTLECVRDVFCFCCFTSLRYSDVANLRRADIFDNHIAITTIKTADALRIELNKYSRAILDKYADQEFPGNLALPIMSNQKMNDYLKDVGRLCGLDTPITITYYRGNERIDEVHPKYELIGTHAGRRTFICNALSLGISPQVVMKWTGHSDYKAMKPYIDIADAAKIDAMSKFDRA